MAGTWRERLGQHGERVAGPPWLFGWRGAPREAPENTRYSLERALAFGLDGLAYEVRRCKSGEFVLLADGTLDRTTDASGALAEVSAAELHGVDAGGWFGREFAGAPVAWLEDAFALHGNAAGARAQHVIELREPQSLPALAERLRELAFRSSVRIATPLRSAALEARDLGLQPLLVLHHPSPSDARFVHAERIGAVGARLRSWASLPAAAGANFERFCLDVDDPAELLEACRTPFNGLTTTEPRRALAIRALAHLTAGDTRPYPLQVSELAIDAETRLGGDGEWCGAWDVAVDVRNPLVFAVRVALELGVRRGAFEAVGLPQELELAAGASATVRVRLRGGSWSPGGDPLLVARFAELHADGSAARVLTLDAPLRRRRTARVLELALRLPMLRESPGEPRASVTIRRQRHDLLVAIEDAGDLADARVVVHLDGDVSAGARGLRVPLPRDFDARAAGVPFSVGILGRRWTPRGPRTVVRRWSGGLPDTCDAGEPGRLVGSASAPGG